MRKRKIAVPVSRPPARRKALEDPIHVENHAVCMFPPNHRVQPFADNITPYPLLHTETAESLPAFVDARYKYDYLAYFDRPMLPPTWMDPELFARMCKHDPRVKAELIRAFKRNKRGPAIKALLPALDAVMEEKYLVYLLEQFAKCREVFAQWLLANYADWKLLHDEKAKTKRTRLARK